MVKISKPVAIMGGIAALAAAAYTGLPPPDGWFFKASDWAFNAVKYAVPEGGSIRDFIDQHPAYTAAIESGVAFGLAGLAIGAFAMRRYYTNKIASKK